jgi:peptidoglycan/LPS O-acetylase OafA/YrhL
VSDAVVDGGALVRTNLWRIFGVSALVASVAAPSTGSAAWLRLAAIGLACLLVYRGLRWALWLLGSMTIIAGALMVYLAVATDGMDWTYRVLFGVCGMVQVLAFLILVRAPEARQFMESQRSVPGPK